MEATPRGAAEGAILPLSMPAGNTPRGGAGPQKANNVAASDAAAFPPPPTTNTTTMSANMGIGAAACVGTAAPGAATTTAAATTMAATGGGGLPRNHLSSPLLDTTAQSAASPFARHAQSSADVAARRTGPGPQPLAVASQRSQPNASFGSFDRTGGNDSLGGATAHPVLATSFKPQSMLLGSMVANSGRLALPTAANRPHRAGGAPPNALGVASGGGGSAATVVGSVRAGGASFNPMVPLGSMMAAKGGHPHGQHQTTRVPADFAGSLPAQFFLALQQLRDVSASSGTVITPCLSQRMLLSSRGIDSTKANKPAVERSDAGHRAGGAAAAPFVVWAVEVKGRLRRDHLRACAQLIVDRHVLLRASLTKDGTSIRVASSAVLPFTFIDGSANKLPEGTTLEDAFRNAVHATAADWAEAKPNVPLFRFLVASEPTTTTTAGRSTSGSPRSPSGDASSGGSPQHSYVGMLAHRLVADDDAMAVMVEDLRLLYQNALDVVRSGSQARYELDQRLIQRLLPPLSASFDRFVEIEQDIAATGMTHRDYWFSNLPGSCATVLELPTDRPRGATYGFKSAVVTVPMSTQVVDALSTWARSVGANIEHALFTGFLVLLYRYTGQDSIPVAVQCRTRPSADLEDAVGPMTNYWLASLKCVKEPKDLPITAILSNVRSQFFESAPHEQYPCFLLTEGGLKAANGHFPLAQAAFAWYRDGEEHRKAQLAPFLLGVGGRHLDWGGIGITSLSNLPRHSIFDLTMRAWEDRAGGIEVALEYNTDLYDADTMSRMAKNLHCVFDALAAAPLTAASDHDELPQQPHHTLLSLPSLSNEEFTQHVVGFNASSALPASRQEQQRDRGVHALMEDAAAQYPRRIAIRMPEAVTAAGQGGVDSVHHGVGQLTYEELNSKANLLARYLRSECGAKTDTVVAICMPRCVTQMVCVLAALKAGAAYLPLDMSYPKDRLEFMLKDSDAVVVLTTRALQTTGDLVDLFAGASCPVVPITECFAEVTHPFLESGESPVSGVRNLNVKVNPDDLSYVIYTSGSTGKPKGVQMRHGALINLVTWQNDYLPPRPSQLLFGW